MVEKVPHRGRAPNHQLGTTRLSLAIADLSFPLRKEEFLNKAGEREVEVEGGVRVPLSQFYEPARVQEIKSLSHALNLAHEHWREAVGLPMDEPKGVAAPQQEPKLGE